MSPTEHDTAPPAANEPMSAHKKRRPSRAPLPVEIEGALSQEAQEVAVRSFARLVADLLLEEPVDVGEEEHAAA